MLTFLRKIRQSSITSNSFRKYLLYAIGEILLVVLGILIALQINNWNNERINRKTEKEVLQRIVQDLRKDLENVDRSARFDEQRLRRGVWVLEQLKKGDSYSKGIAPINLF